MQLLRLKAIVGDQIQKSLTYKIFIIEAAATLKKLVNM
jgi:hypothetical protein